MRPRALALAAVVAALGPAGAARAATTIGADLTQDPTLSGCGKMSDCTYFTGDAITGTPTATVPFDGVVVRWRVKAGSPSSSVALRMLRPSAAGTYSSVDRSDVESVVEGNVTPFATRIPVKAGDVLALDDSAGAKLFAPASTAAYYFQPFAGGAARPPFGRFGNRELLVNADIERDADGDGYGDETQDLCPTDPTRHTACLANLSLSMRPSPAPLTVGRPLTFTIRVGNDGPSQAENVGLVVNLPFTATPLQARAGRGSCSGAFTFTCSFGTIAAGDQATAVLTVRPEIPGTLTVSAQTATSTDESRLDDDSFTSDVTVLPPTLRLIDLRLSRPAIPVGGSTAIRWYMTDRAQVGVTVEQISRRGRLRSVGSFRVSGRPGSNSTTFRGRVPRHRRLKPGNYQFLISAATTDGRVAAPRHLRFTVSRRGR